MLRFFSIIMVVLLAAGLAGCGDTVSADQRIERCLSKQPGSTRADCEKMDQDGQLNDNGVHKGHEGI